MSHFFVRSHLHYPLDRYHLATVNKAAMLIGVQISVEVPAFNSFGYMPKTGIAGSHGNFVFNFFEHSP